MLQKGGESDLKNKVKINSFHFEFAEKLKFFLQTLGYGFESGHVLSRT